MSRALGAKIGIVLVNAALIALNGYLGYCFYRGTHSEVDERLGSFSVTKYAIADEELTAMAPPVVIWQMLDRAPREQETVTIEPKEPPGPGAEWTLILAQVDQSNPELNVGIVVDRNGQQVALAIGERLGRYEVKQVEIVGTSDAREARVTLQNGGDPVVLKMSRVP